MRKRMIKFTFAAVAFSLALLLHTVFYSDSWRQRAVVHADLARLQAQNAALEEQVSELRRKLEALRSRPDVQEHTVRQELGYVQAGDVVLELGSNR